MFVQYQELEKEEKNMQKTIDEFTAEATKLEEKADAVSDQISTD